MQKNTFQIGYEQRWNKDGTKSSKLNTPRNSIRTQMLRSHDKNVTEETCI